MRNLLILILVLALFWWLRGAWRRFERARRDARQPQPAARGAENMVACAHCGVHVPEGESVREGERFFCSDTHRQLGVKR